MKSLVAMAVLAAFAATPALAQSARTAPKASKVQVQQKHSANPKHDVYVNGRYIGSDPDATIRMQLLNDPSQGGQDSGGGGGE
jgi:hypothetical protein